MPEVKVSICIPVYNGGKFLRQCLDTCLQQSFSDYEIVICDDGSTDDSIAILESYAKDKRVRFFKNDKNLGLVGNWNKCLEMAKGEWIKFVFQDDYITSDCLEKFVDAVDADTMLLVSKRYFVLPKNATDQEKGYYSDEVRTLENTGHYKGNLFSAKQISEIAAQNICMNFIGEPSLSFFRKSVVKEIGTFNAHLKQICDLEFLLRIASKYGLKYLPQQLCAFRVHADSTTSTNISARYYTLHYIEPALFSWFLLYDPQFASLRSHLTSFQKIKLNQYFRFKVYRAYKVNLMEKRDHEIFRADIPFKEIDRYKNGTFLVKLADKFI